MPTIGELVHVERKGEQKSSNWVTSQRFLVDSRQQEPEEFSKDGHSMRLQMIKEIIKEYYQAELNQPESPLHQKLEELYDHPDLFQYFRNVKTMGLAEAQRLEKDEALHLKVNKCLGGLPSAVREKVRRVNETPLNLHESAKVGDLMATRDFIANGLPVNIQDLNGITPLGYAVAGNKDAVVKCLLDKKASLHEVDKSLNSALHYAAGYGHVELLEYLLKLNSDMNKNRDSQTPIDVAKINGHDKAIELLQKYSTSD